jgi:uncharacterized protein YjbI with pentapeptide repeats
MSEGSFYGTPAASTNWRGANLENVSFQGDRNDFKGANFSEANLSYKPTNDTQDTGTIEGIPMQMANFEGANLSGRRLVQNDFQDANFDGAKLSGASLMVNDFRGASFRGTEVNEGTWMKHNNFSGAVVPENNNWTAASIEPNNEGLNMADVQPVQPAALPTQEATQVPIKHSGFFRKIFGNKNQ